MLAFLAGAMPLSGQEVKKYRIHVNSPKGHVSGICVMRTDTAGGVMSVVNEFGIKAFDARYHARGRRVELSGLPPSLDRRMVRRVLATDVQVLFAPEAELPRRRTLTWGEGGAFTLYNKRFKIEYELQPIEDVVE